MTSIQKLRSKAFVLLLGVTFIFIFLNSASAASLYENCDIYGNCVKTVKPIVFNNNTAYVNNSNYLQGYTWANAPYPGALYSTYNSTYELKANTGNCPAGQVVMNTTTGGVQCVPRVDPSTTYYINSTSSVGGTITTPNINNTFYYDRWTYNVTEGSGAEPLTLYMNYTNVTKFNEWVMREYYDGSSSHNIIFEMYDYDSGTWEMYYSIVGQAGQTWVVIPVYDSDEHIQNGIVQTRLRHVESGIPAHRLYIDVAWLIDGANVGASTNLDGYARYSFGFNNFTGNGSFTTSSNARFGNNVLVQSGATTNVSLNTNANDASITINKRGTGNYAYIDLGTTTSTPILWTLGYKGGFGTGNEFAIADPLANRLTIINGSGYVGIGTSIPSQTLDVRGIGNFSGTIYINNNTNLATLVNSSFNQTLINSLYVPYNGASGNVNLGNYNLNLTNINIIGSIAARYPNITACDFGCIAFGKVSNGGKISAALSQGTFAFGYVDKANSYIMAGDEIDTFYQGSFASGSVRKAYSYIQAFDRGSFAQGNIASTTTEGSHILAYNQGSFAQGNAYSYTENLNGSIKSLGVGSFAQGDGYIQSLATGAFAQGSGNIISQGGGSFAQGSAGTNYNYRSFIKAFGIGSFAQGNVVGINSTLNATGAGSFAQGYISGNRAKILSSGDGSFAHGYITNNDNYIISSGTNSIILGTSNMTVSGTSSIAFGKNLNITGANTFGYGTNNTMSVITGNNLFALASTNLVISDTNFTAPYPLTVNKAVSNISIFASANMAATGYYTFTDVYDVSKGLAVDKIKNASYYKKADGTINHTAFGYSAVKYTVREQVGVENKNETYESCTTDKGKEPLGLDEEPVRENKITCKNETRIVLVPTYADKTYEAVDLVKEVSLLKQALYEVNERNKNLEIRISIMEDKIK